jgi:hypothetical protein
MSEFSPMHENHHAVYLRGIEPRVKYWLLARRRSRATFDISDAPNSEHISEGAQ